MKCLILAAGYATRLYPLTENFPKPLLKVGEKTILDWLIDDIGEAADSFVVISNHKFAEHLKNGPKAGKISPCSTTGHRQMRPVWVLCGIYSSRLNHSELTMMCW